MRRGEERTVERKRERREKKRMINSVRKRKTVMG